MTRPDKEKQYEEAVETYKGIITKICYYFSTCPEEYKDLRQEVLITIWKGWDSFMGCSKKSTWIYRICFNTCISYTRREKRNRNRVSLEEAMHLIDNSDREILVKYRRMHELISRLSYKERAIILLWLDDKSYEEIAELMGINRNTLAVKIKRIKEKLINLSEK